jgi:hypothetical protein
MGKDRMPVHGNGRGRRAVAQREGKYQATRHSNQGQKRGDIETDRERGSIRAQASAQVPALEITASDTKNKVRIKHTTQPPMKKKEAETIQQTKIPQFQ